jgi:hypothetical protein
MRPETACRLQCAAAQCRRQQLQKRGAPQLCCVCRRHAWHCCMNRDTQGLIHLQKRDDSAIPLLQRLRRNNCTTVQLRSTSGAVAHDCIHSRIRQRNHSRHVHAGHDRSLQPVKPASRENEAPTRQRQCRARSPNHAAAVTMPQHAAPRTHAHACAVTPCIRSTRRRPRAAALRIRTGVAHSLVLRSRTVIVAMPSAAGAASTLVLG